MTALNTIESSELRHLLDGDPEVFVLDVRTAGEFESAHIPGSHHVPVESVIENASRFAEVERDLVLVCQSGNRACKAADALAAAGVDRARVLTGGIGSWIANGADVRRGEERWALDRQVRLAAGSLVLTGFALGKSVKKPFYGLSAAVGAGLVFSAVTNTCAMGTALGYLPYNKGKATDIDSVLTQAQAA